MTKRAKLTFAIANLGCSNCVAAIENAVMPLPGVAYVGVSLTGGTMTVRPGPDLNVGAIVSKLMGLGYVVVDEFCTDSRWLAACPCRSRQ
ncbi:copper ion binding protein [Devosia sp. LC5]|nr:copper ion binding protein [Devosia sp. LC5]